MSKSSSPTQINMWINAMNRAGWYLSLGGDCLLYHADEDAKLSSSDAHSLCALFVATGEIPTPYDYKTMIGRANA